MARTIKLDADTTVQITSGEAVVVTQSLLGSRQKVFLTIEDVDRIFNEMWKREDG